jgi:glycerol uptake facilitator-like aquaporin
MIMVLVMTGSSVSGSGFNPARAFGPAVFTGVWTDHWIYWYVRMCRGILSAARITCM